MSSGGPQARSRDISTVQNIHHCDPHGFTPVRPSRFLDCACARNDNHFCHLERSDSGVERSRVRRTFAAAIRKGSCHFTVETPRFRCASLGVTAFAVMLSGAPLGAKSKHLDSSEHSPLQYIPQCAASEGRTFECSPSPGMAADCRRKAPIRPAETLGKTEMTTFFAKKVILLLQSEKFVLFLNRDPPIGGRLR